MFNTILHFTDTASHNILMTNHIFVYGIIYIICKLVVLSSKRLCNHYNNITILFLLYLIEQSSIVNVVN